MTTATAGKLTKFDNDKVGSTVFLCVDMDLAAEMRRVVLRAVCYYRDGELLKTVLERRRVIVVCLGKRSLTQAHLAADHVQQHCYPEAVGVLDLVEVIGVEPDALGFVGWWEDALGMGRYENGVDFVTQAQARAKWKRPLAGDGASLALLGTGHVGDEYALASNEELGIIGADTVAMAPIDWLWRHRFARGEMALLAGDGGLGKSSILMDIAARISVGGEWPDGSGRAPLGDVVFVSAEDSRESTIAPRLRAMGADLFRIKLVTARVTMKRDGHPVVSPTDLQDRPYWQNVFGRVPECVMAIFDPLPSYLGRGVNDAKNSDLRNVMEPFLDIVVRPRGICLVCNTHLNKATATNSPLHRVSGSHAYGALPRNVHFVVRDAQNPKRRLFCQAKCNNAPDDLPSLAYEMVSMTVQSARGEIETACPVWESKPVVLDLRAAMSSGKDRSASPTGKTLELATWLLGHLRDAVHPVRLGDIFNAAGELGYVGEYGPGKDGRSRWSGGTSLYRAKDAVTSLTGDDSGWAIDESEVDSRQHWQAVSTRPTDHRITGSPSDGMAATPY